MIKNTDSKERQTVCIVDAHGSEIGRTYPKRAAGLVKKGRACYMNDCQIRLNTSDTEQNSEVTKMDNKLEKRNECVRLDFNPRTWSFNPKCSKNVGSRSFMEGPDGALAEAYMIGNWQWDWTEIVSGMLRLEKNTEYVFAFWLNGGENDRNCEVCRFEVVFDYDEDNRYTYNLNRNFIKPVRRLNNWELYELPFFTENHEFTELKFVAQAAYMTVMGAKESAAYEVVEDHPDLYARWRPQRHNLVFADGFPPNNWYSTENLRKQHGHEVGDAQAVLSGKSVPKEPNVQEENKNMLEQVKQQLDELCDSTEALSTSTEKLNEELAEKIEQINEEQIACLIREAMECHPDPHPDAGNVEEIVSQVLSQIMDVTSNLTDEILDAVDDLQDAAEDINDMIEEAMEQ